MACAHGKNRERHSGAIFLRFLHYLCKGLSHPPHVTARKAWRLFRGRLEGRLARNIDLAKCTYGRIPLHGNLFQHFQPVPLECLKPHATIISDLTEHFLQHEFDLLGSGWIRIQYGMECAGVEGNRYGPYASIEVDARGGWLAERINRANVAEAQRLWRLVDPAYQPIDWHIDYKSGYRWHESTWSRDIVYGHRPGVDVKTPWELARMQHLSQFVFAYALAQAGESGFADPKIYACEFRNQILDFMATNPPRFGVNWQCTMDVAIRAANILAAYDLFRAYGAKFDRAFEQALFQTVYDHGRHIASHLEYQENLRANHYLSDIVGLLFIAAYLPRSKEADVWLAFALQELNKEIEQEFHEEGTNFEASTSYHRLASELAVYAVALALGLPEVKKIALREYDHRGWRFPPPLAPGPAPLYASTVTEEKSFISERCLQRVQRMAVFAMDVALPCRDVVQIGDNDNGRLFKMQPSMARRDTSELKQRYANLSSSPQQGNSAEQASYLFERQGDHRHMVAAINGLFDRPEYAEFSKGFYEDRIVRDLAKRSVCSALLQFPEPGPDRGQPPVSFKAYQKFGLYVYRSNRFFLTLRCGPLGQNGNGGHAHNDQLSLTLTVDGHPFVVDPGTYLYTPFPAQRNRFRSTFMHSTLAVPGEEQNVMAQDALFSMQERSKGRLLHMDAHGWTAEHIGFGAVHRREIHLDTSTISVVDTCALPGALVLLHLAPDVRASQHEREGAVVLQNQKTKVVVHGKDAMWQIEESFYSSAYGWVESSLILTAEGLLGRLEWEIELH